MARPKLSKELERVAEKVGCEALIVKYGTESRVYSVALHGEKFKEFAEEFARKKGGKVEKYK